MLSGYNTIFNVSIMKKILFIAAALFSLSAKSQTIYYDSTQLMSYVKVQPVKWRRIDTGNVTKLFVRAVDNLDNSAMLYYELRDNSGNLIARGNNTLSDEAYNEWHDDNKKPFTYLCGAAILNLTISE